MVTKEGTRHTGVGIMVVVSPLMEPNISPLKEEYILLTTETISKYISCFLKYISIEAKKEVYLSSLLLYSYIIIQNVGIILRVIFFYMLLHGYFQSF